MAINFFVESARCHKCLDAPCTKACPKGLDPARGLMSVCFDNLRYAGNFFNREQCAGCDAPCEKACIHHDFPLRIKEIAMTLDKGENVDDVDLSIDFCGKKCENPFFLASSVICNNYEMIAKALRLGWAGVMYKTICFEKISEVSPRFDQVGKGGTPFIGFRNMEQLSEHTPEVDFEIISRLKKDFPSKIVVASIMGQSTEEWKELAVMAENAGADMIELNLSCPQMTYKGMGSDVGQNDELVTLYTRVVKDSVKIPVIAKMTPNITHIYKPALAAILGGADGISAINTIKSVTFNRRSEVNGQKTISGYSGKAVKPIAQRMILEIAQAPLTKGKPLSGMGGITTWQDALEYISIGCTNLQVCTSVMEYGYRIIDDLTSGLKCEMRRLGVSKLDELVGSALNTFTQPEHLDRSTYVLPKFNREKCVGCGRCYISCYDGGHQAIRFDLAERRPVLDGSRCVGCHLCLLVCPVAAIGTTNRIPKQDQRQQSH